MREALLNETEFTMRTAGKAEDVNRRWFVWMPRPAPRSGRSQIATILRGKNKAVTPPGPGDFVTWSSREVKLTARSSIETYHGNSRTAA